MIDVNLLPLEQEGGLMQLLNHIVDPRKPRGVRHPVATVLCIAVCAVLSRARSFCAIAEWVQSFSSEALHTQKDTASFLVQDKGADYLFIAKDNQSTLRQNIADLNLNAFPPSA